MLIRPRFLAHAAGAALLIGAAAGIARADTVFYYQSAPSYYDDGTVTYYEAPRTYYYTTRVYTVPRPTTYYYAPVAPYYAPNPTPYYYRPPGLSIDTPLGTYAPFYGGYSSYGMEGVGGTDSYRTVPDR